MHKDREIEEDGRMKIRARVPQIDVMEGISDVPEIWEVQDDGSLKFQWKQDSPVRIAKPDEWSWLLAVQK